MRDKAEWAQSYNANIGMIGNPVKIGLLILSRLTDGSFNVVEQRGCMAARSPARHPPWENPTMPSKGPASMKVFLVLDGETELTNLVAA